MFTKYGLAIALSWLYLYSFPYFAEIHSANELPRVYLTQAIVEEGRFAIDTGVARWGRTADVSRAYGHDYSNKAPGSSFLAVPAYAALSGVKSLFGWGPTTLAEMVWVCRVFSGIIPALLFLVLLARFLSRFSSPRDPTADGARIALVGYALGSMAMTYSILFISHQLSAICIGTAYILSVWVIEDGRDPRWLWAVGVSAGCAPLVDYQAAFAGVPLAVYLIVHLVRARRYRHLAYAVLGAVPPIAALLVYHDACFGSPLSTGYDHSQTFAHFHQQGFLGITAFRTEALYGSTLSAENGLLTLCPMLILAIPGWALLARRKAYWHLGITLSVVAIYLAFISSINFWRGGWQLGPRYITAMLPFVMVPVTVAISEMTRFRTGRALAVALVTTGVVVYAVSCALFPHFPEKFDNPLYEVTFRLIADDLAPYNLGYALGLRGFASLVPYLGVLAGVLAWMAYGSRDPGDPDEPGARRLLWAVSGVSGAVVLLASYSAFDGGGPVAERAYQWITTTFP